MANQENGPSWDNNDIDFVPDFYLPQNQYYPTTTTPSSNSNWHKIAQYTGSMSVFTRYAMKFTIFVLVALFGIKMSVPAVAEAPVFNQLSNGLSINKILENVPIAEVQEAASAASSATIGSANMNIDGTFHNSQSEDVTFYENPVEESVSDEGLVTADEEEVSETNASNESVSDESLTEQDAVEATEDEGTNETTATESNVVEETTSNESNTDTLVYEGSTGCCIWPVRGRVTSRVTRWHTAIDLAAPYWSPVVAADGGRVIAAGWDRTGYGYRMIINHGNGISTLYAHLARYYYDYGDYVNKGMIIGRVGSTGNSTGNHLHFEVRRNNYRENPWNWLP